MASGPHHAVPEQRLALGAHRAATGQAGPSTRPRMGWRQAGRESRTRGKMAASSTLDRLQAFFNCSRMRAQVSKSSRTLESWGRSSWAFFR